MNLIILPIVDSTNYYAHTLLEEGLVADNTVVLALEQTNGRGQRGKNWESASNKGLYATFIFRPQHIVAQQQFILNKAISSGVAAYVEERIQQTCLIKWPNDMLVDEKKLSGLLIENNLRGNQIAAVIAGIGINLNQLSFKGEFETLACSMRMLTGLTYNPEEEIRILYKHVNVFYQQFINGNLGIIEHFYDSHLFKKNQIAGFISEDKIFSAILEEVDNNGAAILNMDGEKIHATHPKFRFYMNR